MLPFLPVRLCTSFHSFWNTFQNLCLEKNGYSAMQNYSAVPLGLRQSWVLLQDLFFAVTDESNRGIPIKYEPWVWMKITKAVVSLLNIYMPWRICRYIGFTSHWRERFVLEMIVKLCEWEKGQCWVRFHLHSLCVCSKNIQQNGNRGNCMKIPRSCYNLMWPRNRAQGEVMLVKWLGYAERTVSTQWLAWTLWWIRSEVYQ